MNKYITLVGAFIFSGAAMGQLATQPLSKLKASKQLTAPKGSTHVPMKGACVLEEDFEGGSIPATWDIGPQVEQQDDNTGAGLGTFVDAWYVGDAVTANAGGYLPVPDAPAGNLFAMANDDADPCNCDLALVHLTTPMMDFSGLTDMAISFRCFNDENFGGGPSTVSASNDGGATWTTIDTIPAVAATWQSITTSLSGYDNEASVHVRFSWGDGGTGNWATGIAVDDVCVSVLLDDNLTLVQAFLADATPNWADPAVRSFEYSYLPIEQAIPQDLSLIVVNNGGLVQTNVIGSADIMVNGSSVGTFTSTAIPSLAPGAKDTIIINTGWTPSVAGSVSVDFLLSADATDLDPGDNTATRTMTLTDVAPADGYSVMGRDRNSAASFQGNGMDGFKLANRIEITNSNSICYGIGVGFGNGSDVGTLVQGELLDANRDPIATTVDYFITGNELNNTGDGIITYIPLDAPTLLNALEDVFATINHFGSATLRIGTSGSSPEQTSNFFDYTDNTWYYVTSTPMVRLFLAEIPVGVTEIGQVDGLTLGANMPNPFNNNTSIQYELAEAKVMSFEVLDVTGKVVHQQDLGKVQPGTHMLEFDATTLSEGVYNYALVTAQGRLSRRMIIVR